ncbi:LuxR C-terminal-related transcriptional regulator [Azospirillum palustre]
MVSLDSCDQKYLEAVTVVYGPEGIAHSSAWPSSTTSERVDVRLSVQDREFLADLLAHVNVRSMLGLITVSGSAVSIRGALDLRKLPLNTACALMAVASGAQLPALTEGVAEELTREVSLEDLTERQRDVLAQVCVGASNKEIGRALRMTEGTVKIHVSAIMQRLGVENRVQAAIIGRRLFGLISHQGA